MAVSGTLLRYVAANRSARRVLLVLPLWLLIALLVVWFATVPLLFVTMTALGVLWDITDTYPTEIRYLLISSIAGALGAYIRVAINITADIELSSESDYFYEKLQLIIGAIMGLAGYFLLANQFIVALLYKNAQPFQGEVTPQSVAIFGALAGLLARELVERVIKKYKDPNADEPPAPRKEGSTS
jgi:hypothetical protein